MHNPIRAIRSFGRNWGVWALLLITAPGCSICCNPYLEDYAAFGSRTPRSNMKYGRVGSPFSDPDFQGGFQVEENSLPYDEVGEEIHEGAIVDESEELILEP